MHQRFGQKRVCGDEGAARLAIAGGGTGAGGVDAQAATRGCKGRQADRLADFLKENFSEF